jgi:hypothetical protein
MTALLLSYTALSQVATPGPPKKPRLAKLVIQVTDLDRAPVKNVQVSLESLGEDRFEKKAETNRNGIAKLTDIPLGKFRIQVTGLGWKTWGEDRELSEQTHTIAVLLEKEQ